MHDLYKQLGGRVKKKKKKYKNSLKKFEKTYAFTF